MIQVLSSNRMPAGFMFQNDKPIICDFRYIIRQCVNAGCALPMLRKRQHLHQSGLGMWPGTPPSISARSMKQISRPSDSAWCKRNLSVFKNTPHDSRNRWTCEKIEKLVSIWAQVPFSKAESKYQKRQQMLMVTAPNQERLDQIPCGKNVIHFWIEGVSFHLSLSLSHRTPISLYIRISYRYIAFFLVIFFLKSKVFCTWLLLRMTQTI